MKLEGTTSIVEQFEKRQACFSHHTILRFCCTSINANGFGNPRNLAMNLYPGSLDADEQAGILENLSSNIAIGLASNHSMLWPGRTPEIHDFMAGRLRLSLQQKKPV